MSEYQYYEFVAIDRPLSARDMADLRRISTRATITRTRFVNHYEWGDFKGYPSKLVARYFDAFLYLANWGTRQVMLGVPQKAIDMRLAKRCCDGHAARISAKNGRAVIELTSDLEEHEDWDEDGRGWLASLLHVRSELMAGDERALYLFWLLGVIQGDHADDAREPFVPKRLDRPTAALASLAEYLRIDEDLLAAAAEGRVELRTAGDLRARAEILMEEREQREAVRAARAAERRARAEEVARIRRLDQLAKREAHAWREAEDLVATKKARAYDEAVALLIDLRDLAARTGRSAEATARISDLCLARLSQRALIDRVKRAGLA
jgi:hypothetical protein